MKSYPKKVRLKDGTQIVLRPMIKKDVGKLLEFFKGLPDEDRMFLKEDVTKRKVIEGWAKELDYKRILPILAETKGKIIGDATLHRPRHGWSRHVGEIRMVVAKKYQRNGLGTILAREMYHHAMESKLEKLTAQAMETQVGAIKAFEKLGFKKEAVLTDQVIDIKGRKQNLIIMTNYVEDLWSKMEEIYSTEKFAATVRQ